MNVIASLPLLIISCAAGLALMLGLVPHGWTRRVGANVAAGVGIVAALVACVVQWGDRTIGYHGNVYSDRFSLLIQILVLVSAGATIMLSVREPAAVDRRGEYAALILLSTAGMMLTATAGDIIVIFLGIELLSVSLYILCALEVWRNRSLESGLKYLISGAVGAAILLYGLTLLYGATGHTNLGEIGKALFTRSLTTDPMVLGAMALIIGGLAFKASAAPFHMWAPDVYEGAPTPVTAFMATATKVAALAAFLRILFGTLPAGSHDWRIAVGVVAAASIVIGNIAALRQNNIKRLLAYSGVAQAGYLLIGVASGLLDGAQATLYYLAAYVAMTLAVFAVVIIRERETEKGDELAAFAGMGRTRPVLGIAATVGLLSLAGFPPLSGFLGKLFIFKAAVDEGLVWLAVIGALGSVVSLGYYLRLAGLMWFAEPDESGRKIASRPTPNGLVAVTAAVVVVALAIGAGPMLEICRSAAESLLAP